MTDVEHAINSDLGKIDKWYEENEMRRNHEKYNAMVMHLSMLCPRGGGGGPRDRVGTLIRNKNLESNFLTLGIRF